MSKLSSTVQQYNTLMNNDVEKKQEDNGSVYLHTKMNR